MDIDSNQSTKTTSRAATTADQELGRWSILRCIDLGQATTAWAKALPTGDAVDQFAGADEKEGPLTHLATALGRPIPKSELHGFHSPKKGLRPSTKP